MQTEGLRVTHVVSRNHRRGAATAAVHLSAALEARDIDNQLLALLGGPPGHELPNVRSLGGRGWLGWFAAVIRLRHAVKWSKPDVIVAHSAAAAFAAATAFPFGGSVPIVWHRISKFQPHAASRSRGQLPACQFPTDVVVEQYRSLFESLCAPGLRSVN